MQVIIVQSLQKHSTSVLSPLFLLLVQLLVGSPAPQAAERIPDCRGHDGLERQLEVTRRYFSCYQDDDCLSRLDPGQMYCAWKQIAEFPCQENPFLIEALEGMEKVSFQWDLGKAPCLDGGGRPTSGAARLNAPAKNLALAAEQIARELAPPLLEEAPETGSYRMAVLPFGDLQGRASQLLGLNPQLLQGSLIDALRSELGQRAPGKFRLLSPSELRTNFEALGLDPAGLTPKDPLSSQAVLKKANLQVGILGSFLIGDQESLSKRASVQLEALAFLPGQEFFRAHTTLDAFEALKNGGQEAPRSQTLSHSGRFGIEFFWKSENDRLDDDRSAWKQLPLLVDESRELGRETLLYLSLPEELRGRRYKISLKNYGEPADQRWFHHDPETEKQRLFAAALLIDGVNSLYQPGPEHTPGPVVVHPSRADKWVLTGPGQRLQPDPTAQSDTLQGARLVDAAEGADHSEVEIRGFQKGEHFADAFLWSESSASIASNMGITESIGMILIYFYAEKLPGDEKGRSLGAGTQAGEQLESRTFDVQFDLYEEPVEIWRIFYRFEGSPELPKRLRPLKR